MSRCNCNLWSRDQAALLQRRKKWRRKTRPKGWIVLSTPQYPTVTTVFRLQYTTCASLVVWLMSVKRISAPLFMSVWLKEERSMPPV